MLWSKVHRLLFSLKAVGFQSTILIFWYRAKKRWFISCLRQRALQRTANCKWQDLAIDYKVSWEQFFEDLHKRSLPDIELFFSSMPRQLLQKYLKHYTQNELQALGSGWHKIDAAIWHTDIRLKQKGSHFYSFNNETFYADVVIESSKYKELGKDIKVPWELSRLQHLPLLAYAYKNTSEELYKKTFVDHVEHWHQHNPYLIGINWVCPMEVALRAISLLLSFDVFKTAEIGATFWQKYSALLYDHMQYLEHNWEWYDGRTSNHYLANLVGYLYLCWFFRTLPGVSKKIKNVVKEIVRELEKQVFKEGTSYEGSTHYHALVTELFYHVQQLCVVMNIVLPDVFHERLRLMVDFLYWSSINENEMISIGDHDSGKVTFYGLNIHHNKIKKGTLECQKHFNQFGLSIFKDDRWHLSLRHHAYAAQQPSGHHHNDVASVTLAINQIPVIVDPGSYVYTASTVMRNRFRSVNAHNVMYLNDREPVPLSDHLFYLSIPSNTTNIQNIDKKIWQTSHRLYEQEGLVYNREIVIDENSVVINDKWINIANNKPVNYKVNMNMTFSHHIYFEKDGCDWIGLHNNKPLFRLTSSIDLRAYRVYVSLAYGIRKRSIRLSASVPLQCNVPFILEFHCLST